LRIYLDYAATTPVDPEVLRAMELYLRDAFGNPSSIHSFGKEAKLAVEEARRKVAALIGAREEEVIFTSGGTEANNMVLWGFTIARVKKGGHIVTSSIEHPSILETCRFLQSLGIDVTYVRVDRYGMVDPDEVRRAITPRTFLISIMHANNEVGTIQPIKEIAKVAKEAGIPFHTDAVQTVGHIPVNVDDLGVDLLSFSAHKMYGPKGIGGLYVREGILLLPFLRGGGQERGLRSGTENVPGIVGLGKAAELAMRNLTEEMSRLQSLRDRFIKEVLTRIPGAHLNGHPTQRLPGNAHFSFDGVEGEALVINLDLEGVAVSSGAACHSRHLEPSHVLLAMGMDRSQALGAVRFSFGRWTREEHIEEVIEILQRLIMSLRRVA